MDVTFAGIDDWSRILWKSTKTGNIYVQVDGGLCTRTSWDEPCNELCKMKDVTTILTPEQEVDLKKMRENRAICE